MRPVVVQSHTHAVNLMIQKPCLGDNLFDAGVFAPDIVHTNNTIVWATNNKRKCSFQRVECREIDILTADQTAWWLKKVIKYICAMHLEIDFTCKYAW